MENLTVKLETIVDENFIVPFSKFCGYGHTSKVAYSLSKLVKAVNAAAQDYKEQVTKARLTYGDPVMDGDKPTFDQAGNPYLKFSPENTRKAEKELADLRASESVELPIKEKVKISHAKMEELKIYPSAFEMQAADHFVEFVD